MKKIKILMVAGSMHMGGLENQLMHFLRNVDRNKYQIDFTSNEPDAFFRKEIESLGGGFIIISSNSRKNPIKYCLELYRIMKDGKYDIVHSHELFHSGINLFIAKLAKVKSRFAHAHSWCEGDQTGGDYSIGRKIYHSSMRFLINNCSTVQLACSSWAGNFLYGKKVVNGSSFHLIYNSIDTSLYLDNYNQIETGDFCEEDGWKNVIYVARICALKNHFFLTGVAKELKQRNQKIRFLFVGDGEEKIKKELEEIIEKNQLEEYIQLLGEREDVDVLLRKSSAFVTPSKYEGMPLVMLEAQATGLPCISADTYSREVDFDIGMVRWLDLSEGIKVWTDTIEEVVTRPRADKEKVVCAINRKGFDSKIFTRKLCTLYMKDLNKRGIS